MTSTPILSTPVHPAVQPATNQLNLHPDTEPPPSPLLSLPPPPMLPIHHPTMCTAQQAVHPQLSQPPPPVLPCPAASDTTASVDDLDSLLLLKNEYSSRRNFALKQAEKLYSKEERLTSNCTGKRGKKQLDQVRLGKIKEATFKLWPLDSKENPTDARKDCKRAIDKEDS